MTTAERVYQPANKEARLKRMLLDPDKYYSEAWDRALATAPDGRRAAARKESMISRRIGRT